MRNYRVFCVVAIVGAAAAMQACVAPAWAKKHPLRPRRLSKSSPASRRLRRTIVRAGFQKGVVRALAAARKGGPNRTPTPELLPRLFDWPLTGVSPHPVIRTIRPRFLDNVSVRMGAAGWLETEGSGGTREAGRPARPKKEKGSQGAALPKERCRPTGSRLRCRSQSAHGSDERA